MTEEKEVKVSTTDPYSEYLVREGKPEGFVYLDRRTVDLEYNLVTDVYVMPGNVHDSVPYLSRLNRQRERFGFDVESVALDAGYLSTPICKGLEDRKIFGVIAHRRFHPTPPIHSTACPVRCCTSVHAHATTGKYLPGTFGKTAKIRCEKTD